VEVLKTSPLAHLLAKERGTRENSFFPSLAEEGDEGRFRVKLVSNSFLKSL
jgi:hypothetical protein